MSFVAIVHHEIQPGKVSEAAERINGNGKRMAQRPGFVSRDLLQPTDGRDQLTTVTYWENEETYEGWVKYNRENNPHKGAPSPYIGSPDTHLFNFYIES